MTKLGKQHKLLQVTILRLHELPPFVVTVIIYTVYCRHCYSRHSSQWGADTTTLLLWRWKDGLCPEEVETQKQAFQLLTLLGFSQGTALKLSLDSHSTFWKCSSLYKKNHTGFLCKGCRAPGTWRALNFSLPLFLSYIEKHLKQRGFLVISCKWSWEEKLLIALTDLQEAHPQHAQTSTQ